MTNKMTNKTDTLTGGAKSGGVRVAAVAPLKRIALVCAATLCATAGSVYAQTGKSSGVYRIPFVSGTQVHVTNDHTKHSPPGRIDMSGKGNASGEYKIVAAADGRIKYIEDSFSKQVESD